MKVLWRPFFHKKGCLFCGKAGDHLDKKKFVDRIKNERFFNEIKYMIRYIPDHSFWCMECLDRARKLINQHGINCDCGVEHILLAKKRNWW